MNTAFASLQDLDALKKWLHGVNNHLGVILATAELLQLDSLPPSAATRCRTIENEVLEIREMLRAISDRYFPDPQ